MEVGIIGQGFVGSAIRSKFNTEFDIYAYDIQWDTARKFSKGGHTVSTLDTTAVSPYCELIFVCVPTPMNGETGKCDTSIVEGILKDLDAEAQFLGKELTAVIKSTIPPGTAAEFDEKFKNIVVCFSPEFLTEANAVEDFANQNRIVIGAKNGEVYKYIKHFFYTVFGDHVTYMHLSTTEAEMVKYIANLFFATKVSFFNDMYRVCERLGVDFDKAVETAVLDPRIGKSHYKVPGPDGDFGFGGHCFPKDTNAILYLCQTLGLEVPTIEGMWKSNEMTRENKDWLKMQGRAVS